MKNIDIQSIEEGEKKIEIMKEEEDILLHIHHQDQDQDLMKNQKKDQIEKK